MGSSLGNLVGRSISISLSRLVSPWRKVMALRWQPNESARNFMSSTLALPSTGGLLTRTIHRSPRRVPNVVFFARGMIRSRNCKSAPSQQYQLDPGIASNFRG